MPAPGSGARARLCPGPQQPGQRLAAQGLFDGALDAYHRALHYKPDYVEVYDHVGLVLQCQGRIAEAIDWFTRALEQAPEAGRPHELCPGMPAAGGFARGWAEYEWRFRCREHPILAQGMPLWDGSRLEGRRILLWAEQGLGDTLQFVRYASAVAAQGGHVVVSCPPAAMSVVGTCPGVSQVIREGTPQTGFACHAPLMSLPRIFATTLETIPASIPYLSADPARASRWGGELGRYDGFKIGIAWQGNTDHKKDHLRSFRLERFEALGRIPGVRLFSLQVGSSTKQLQEISDRLFRDRCRQPC